MSNAKPPRRLDTAIQQKDRQERFLAAFELSGNVKQACHAARIHRQTHYYWLREDPTYAKRYEMARQLAAQSLEDEAVRRAMEGVRRPVLYQGQQVVTFEDGIRKPLYEHEYSDTLLAMLLRAANPARFNPPKETINLLELEPELLTTAQLDKLLEHLIVKMAGPDPKAQEAARRDLAAGPTPMGTPDGRVKEAAVALRDIITRFDALPANASAPDYLVLMADVRRVMEMFSGLATAIEANSEELGGGRRSQA
jgi:hypothetical protein